MPLTRALHLACGAAVILVSAAPAVAAPTYKCIIDGRTVFQQTGCPINAQADASQAASAPVAAVVSTPRGRVAPGVAMGASAPVSAPTGAAAARSGASMPRAATASSVQINIPRK